MEFILIIVILIGFFAWEQIQPLINLPIINLTIINIALILLWLIILLGAILIFINLLKFFLNNTLLFSPSKWQKSWVCFGLIRFALTFSLFYILYIHPTPRTSTPIFNDFSIIEFFVFSFFSLGIYTFLSPLYLFWEIRKITKENLECMDYQKFCANLDPVAHKLGLYKIIK